MFCFSLQFHSASLLLDSPSVLPLPDSIVSMRFPTDHHIRSNGMYVPLPHTKRLCKPMFRNSITRGQFCTFFVDSLEPSESGELSLDVYGWSVDHPVMTMVGKKAYARIQYYRIHSLGQSTLSTFERNVPIRITWSRGGSFAMYTKK